MTLLGGPSPPSWRGFGVSEESLSHHWTTKVGSSAGDLSGSKVWTVVHLEEGRRSGSSSGLGNPIKTRWTRVPRYAQVYKT